MANHMQYPPVTTNQNMRQYPPATYHQNSMNAMDNMGSMNHMGTMNHMDATNNMDMQPVLRLAPQEGLTGTGMTGSMQEALADNLGLYAVCEFVVGTQEMQTKAGILYSVGRSFVVLYDEQQQNFILCDVFSIKFVTLYMPGHRPWNITRMPPVPMVEIPGVGTVPAGPYGIGTGSTPQLQNLPQNRASFSTGAGQMSGMNMQGQMMSQTQSPGVG